MFIHGCDEWNKLGKGKEADEFAEKVAEKVMAAATGGDEAKREADIAEAERMARYIWAVRGIGGKDTDTGQTAICLSGGGIRSAAFALGILQGLAGRGLLDKFHYLSTVSGGGYIGAWLSAWRNRKGFAAVESGLSPRAPEQLDDPVPLRRLRFNQKFLTPRSGLASSDTWAALATVLRDLLLNWLVYIPLILSILLIPRIVQAWLVLADHPNAADDAHSSLVALFSFLIPGTDPKDSVIPGIDDWRSWLDSAAVLCLVFGFSVSAICRPAAGARMAQGGLGLSEAAFVCWVLVPLLIAALLLNAAIASWIGKYHKPVWTNLERYAILGAAVYSLTRLVAYLYHLCQKAPRDRGSDTGEHMRGTLLVESIGWAVAGTCTGAVIGFGVQLARWRYPSLSGEPERQAVATWFAVCGPPWLLMSVFIGEVVYVGATSRSRLGGRDREWLARASGWFAKTAIAYLIFSWVVLAGWHELTTYEVWLTSVLTGSGVLTLLGAVTPLTKATTGAPAKEAFPVTKLVALSAGVFIIVGSAALAEGLRQFLDLVRPQVASWFEVKLIPLAGSVLPGSGELCLALAMAVTLLGVSLVLSLLVNVNWFSLHALYRNRLVKTFLGASNTGKNEHRNRFDGFSQTDDIRMWELSMPSQIQGTPTDPRDTKRLFPVVNMSLNVLASKNLAWQDRKAVPFVSTPLRTGASDVGYRSSKEFGAGRWSRDEQKAISLGTAMAISGAALSPNWGYHSSPFTSFIMMMFNVRLGWWLGNPKTLGYWWGVRGETWRLAGPNSSLRLFIQEALGQTDDAQPWVYVSDGGHFENLGLYEMIRRRCRTIVVSDAGADPNCTLEDLGNAVRKVAVDLGVTVDFRRIDLRKRATSPLPGVYCAVGDIRYPEGRDGKIVYFKPGFYGKDEPADVRAYAAANAKFPHEGTWNQWFSEAQFESYRSLGNHVIQTICKPDPGKISLAQFVTRSQEYLSYYEERYETEGATVVQIRPRKRPATETDRIDRG